MTLRTPRDHLRRPSRRHSSARLLGPSVLLVVLLLAVFAGSSGAGVAQYAGTLYFDGPASSRSGTSFQILTTAGPSPPAAAPTIAPGLTGSGTIPSGSYQYVYIAANGSAKTLSPV